MASQSEKIALSLEVLKDVMGPAKRTIFKANEFSRVHRERLVKAGFLLEIKRGWLLLSDPVQNTGESTLWYANFWNFVSLFLEERFGRDYCLSVEGSLILHTGSSTIPGQISVMTKKSSGDVVHLPFNTSLFLYQTDKDLSKDREVIHGLQVLSLPEAISRLPRSYFEQYPTEAVIALSQIRDANQLLYHLLRDGRSTIAGYLVGAYRHMGREDMAQKIHDSMENSGHKIVVDNPFVKPVVSIPVRVQSPYAARLRTLWDQYRTVVLDLFPKAPGLSGDMGAILSAMDEKYESDAYNSLSIEGYEVTHGLIERVRDGKWDPINEMVDIQQKDALAAKGYRLAFESVRESIMHVLQGQNPGKVVRQDLSDWYRALFQPSVQVGLLKDYQLLGYRTNQVYIRNSRHIPFPQTALLDSMDTFFELLEGEENPSVRVVLGHFVFVYIHPYSDGNGRLGRFLMNTMLLSGGYPWLVVPVTRRMEYMNALEQASCNNNISHFTLFLRSLL